MRVLALDVTAPFGSLALLDGAQLLEEVLLHSSEGFGSILFSCITDLLARHAVSLASIDCFAAASGPGSFTGVRIGLTVVKSLAEAIGKPAIGVSNLMALAACGTTPVRAALIDGRRGEVYGAVYDPGLATIVPEVVAPLAGWLASLPVNTTEVVSPNLAIFIEHLPKGTILTERRAIAAGIARIASARIQAGETGDPAALDANYVRRCDAEQNWKDEAMVIQSDL